MRPALTIVLPCYNEAAVLPETHRRLAEVADRLKSAGAFEFIFVDDGSKDETAGVLHDLARTDARVRDQRRWGLVTFVRFFDSASLRSG